MEEIIIKVPSGTYPTRKKYYREILDIFFQMGYEWRTGGTDYRMSYLVPDTDLYVCLRNRERKLVLTFSHKLELTDGRSIDLDELREMHRKFNPGRKDRGKPDNPGKVENLEVHIVSEIFKIL